MEEKEVNKKDNNSSNNLSETFLSGNKLEEENLKRQLEYNKMKLSYQNNFYPENNDINKFLSQRHLYDHKKEKKDLLINIIDKNLQLEYMSEVNNIFKKIIFTLFLSILIFIQTLLILHNYKNYNEVLLSQIFSAFVFFNSFFLIVQIYRQALRDAYRSKLFRLFSLFLSTFYICLFLIQLMNIYIIYHKIQIRKKKCASNKKFCEDSTVNTIILVLSFIHLILFIIINIFPICLGYRSIKILFYCDYEVYQKQLLENEKKNKKEEKKELNKDEMKEKTDKNENTKNKNKNKNKKHHLKSE